MLQKVLDLVMNPEIFQNTLRFSQTEHRFASNESNLVISVVSFSMNCKQFYFHTDC